MALPRVIPVLLLSGKGLVKTVKFKDPKYIGDPINAVKIFNEKEVDEILLLDIRATKEKRDPDYNYLKEIVSECFSPITYGGAITSVEQIKRIIQSGIEKVAINAAAISSPDFIKQASDSFGSSTIVGAIDIKRNFWKKYAVYSYVENKTMNLDPVVYAEKLQQLGVGELFINNVDRDGTMEGYDHEIIQRITHHVDIPVIACGGCSGIPDIVTVIKQDGASAAAAGSLFVFHGKHRAVLITYPDYELISERLRA